MRNVNWNKAFPEAPQSFKNRVITTLNTLPEKENEKMGIMKKKSIKRSMIFVTAIVMALGLTAFASGKIASIVSSSSSIADYKKMPTQEEVTKEFGFSPKLVESFANGYTFKSGSIANCDMTDADGNSMGTFKSLGIEYAKEDDVINLSMEQVVDSEWLTKGGTPTDYNGVALYYGSYENKFVPADYKLTEQDKKDEASGKYVFSYGSNEIKLVKIQSVTWQQDGIGYCLLGMDSPLDKSELTKMAQEIVDKK